MSRLMLTLTAWTLVGFWSTASFGTERALDVSRSAATWNHTTPAGGAELRVAGPGGISWRAVFEAGEHPVLHLVDLHEALLAMPTPDDAEATTTPQLSDGSYNWELRPLAGGDVLAGKLRIRDGAFAPSPPLKVVASADQVFADDLIAERACFGPDCADGEVFGAEQLKVASGIPRMLFDADTATDWIIDTNRTPDRFVLGTPATTSSNVRPRFSVDAGLGSSLHLTPNGVGVNTSTPEGTLHVFGGPSDPARLVLETFLGPRWEFIGSAAIGRLWLRERAGSQHVLSFSSGTNARMRFDSGSDAAFLLQNSEEVFLSSGKANTRLTVAGGADTYAAFGTGTGGFNVGSSRASFGDGSGFLNIRPNPSAVAPNPSIRFMVGNQPAMILDNEGYLGISGAASFNPGHPIELESGAHVTAGGVWTNASSRTLKTGIEPLPTSTAIATLEALEPVRFRYEAEPDETYLGFIAEDVPDAVAHGDRRSLSPMDVVAVLTEVVKLQERRLDLQAEELAWLRLEVARLSRESDAP